MNPTRFCESIPIEQVMDCTKPTLNQRLAGAPSPRMCIPPIIMDPITDLNWSSSHTRTQINEKRAQYPYSSGWKMKAVPLQPNIYTISENTEPINATNGIAFTPAFPAHSYALQNGDTRLFVDTEHALHPGAESHPNNGEAPTLFRTFVEEGDAPRVENVYDPRLTGYGSDNRSYTDPYLGQTRFFYDDVDSIRMPKYICKSKIDTLNIHGQGLNSMRADVEKSWSDDSLAFREDMMRSLMRKRNEELVQTRLAPKYTLW